MAGRESPRLGEIWFVKILALALRSGLSHTGTCLHTSHNRPLLHLTGKRILSRVWGKARYHSLPWGARHRQIVALTQPSESSVGAILKALPLPFLLSPCSVLLFVSDYDQAPNVLSSGPEMAQEGLGVDIKPEFSGKRA